MKQRRHVFIINPAAGKRDSTTAVASEIAEKARASGADYEIHVTEYPRHACLLVQQVAQAYPGQPLRFYACGGDGTLNEVATTAVKVPNSSVTHLPTGSGNDFIKIFGEAALPRFEDLLALMDGDEVVMDYIESDCGLALNVLTAGVDARVAQGMQKYKRIPGLHGQGAYLASMVENVIRGLHDPYRVELDGETLDDRYTLIMAANGRWYGGGFNAVPDADPQDGLLDILLVRAVSRFKAAGIIGAYKAGRYRELPEYITYRRASEMTLLSAGDRPMTVNLDGEIERTTRITLRVAAGKLRFAVPRGVVIVPPAEPAHD